jgi:hypothetical protein
MQREPVTIVIGQKIWELKPMTIGQVEKIEAAMAEPRSFKRMVDIIVVALSVDHKDDAKNFRTFETGDIDEYALATRSILYLAGMRNSIELTEEEKRAGEAKAAAAAPLTGDGSAAA